MTYWAVAETFSGRVHRVRGDVEALRRGSVYVPTYANGWQRDGRERRVPLMYGYIFFQTDGSDWSGLKRDDRGRGVEGVYNIISNCGVASRVREEEIGRMIVDEYCRAHDVATVAEPPKDPVRSRRRPRRSRRARMRARRVALVA